MTNQAWESVSVFLTSHLEFRLSPSICTIESFTPSCSFDDFSKLCVVFGSKETSDCEWWQSRLEAPCRWSILSFHHTAVIRSGELQWESDVGGQFVCQSESDEMGFDVWWEPESLKRFRSNFWPCRRHTLRVRTLIPLRAVEREPFWSLRKLRTTANAKRD